jgi:methylglutaconyl-CoA hydratase
LRGAGPHFCAGADIQTMQKMNDDNNENYLAEACELAELLWRFYTFPKPTITLSHGATMGGGIGLLAASDIVLASPDASYAFSEVKLGVIPAIISPYVLHAIGNRAARRYFLTGERFQAQEAYRLGLVHEVLDQEKLLETALEMGQSLAKNGPHALSAVKTLIHDVQNQVLDQLMTLQLAERLAFIRATPEAREGLQAFLEKRQPQWS